MKTAKCQCKSNKCEIEMESDDFIPVCCPMGFTDEHGNNRANWTFDGIPSLLSKADKIKMKASAWIMEQAAFVTAYDGHDEVGGAVTDLESMLGTMCTDREIFDCLHIIEDALQSVKTRFPDWESSGDCHAFINVIEGECDDIKRMLKSPGSSLEDLGKHFGV